MGGVEGWGCVTVHNVPIVNPSSPVVCCSLPFAQFRGRGKTAGIATCVNNAAAPASFLA